MARYRLAFSDIVQVADVIRERCTLKSDKITFPWGFIDNLTEYSENLTRWLNSSIINSLNFSYFLNVSQIPSYAFYFQNISGSFILSKCISIGEGAFQQCSYLSAIDISQCSYIGNQAFQYCSQLSMVNIPQCSYIGEYAFMNCILLKTIEMSNCEFIKSSAFNGCKQLSTINIALCKSIDSYAFFGCSSLSLSNINLSQCQIIGSRAFGYCKSLTQLSLPNCRKLEDEIFYSCTNLSILYLLSTSIVSITSNTFSGTLFGNGSIYVPASLLAQYQVATYWSKYANKLVGI